MAVDRRNYANGILGNIQRIEANIEDVLDDLRDLLSILKKDSSGLKSVHLEEAYGIVKTQETDVSAFLVSFDDAVNGFSQGSFNSPRTIAETASSSWLKMLQSILSSLYDCDDLLCNAENSSITFPRIKESLLNCVEDVKTSISVCGSLLVKIEDGS